MTTSQLTEEQQKDLINALQFGSVGFIDPVLINLMGYNPSASLTGRTSHSIMYKLDLKGDNFSYWLNIDYYDKHVGRNPETITIRRLNGGKSDELLPLSSIRQVTDMLREYRIW